MTPNPSLLADCIFSGQVPADEIVRLRADHPGLAEELNRRSSAATLGAERCDAAGVCVPPTHADPRSIDPFHFVSDAPLALRSGEEEGRNHLKSVGLLSQFLSSIHLPSFATAIWRR